MHQTSAIVSVLVAAAVSSSVDAMPSFLKLIPGSMNVPGVPAIGHSYTGGGGGLNTFGEAFDANGQVWSEALCYKDSDNDGQFNGAELGDPCCEWKRGTNEKLAYTTATSPGDASSKQDPAIWANIKCANGQDPLTKFTAMNGNKTASDSMGEKVETTTKPKATTTPAPTQKSSAVGTSTATAAVVAVVLTVVAALV